jgi:hypothetical protein
MKKYFVNSSDIVISWGQWQVQAKVDYQTKKWYAVMAVCNGAVIRKITYK